MDEDAHLTRLPAELLFHICRLLPVADLSRMSAPSPRSFFFSFHLILPRTGGVCRSLRVVANADSLWRPRYLQRYYHPIAAGGGSASRARHVACGTFVLVFGSSACQLGRSRRDTSWWWQRTNDAVEAKVQAKSDAGATMAQWPLHITLGQRFALLALGYPIYGHR